MVLIGKFDIFATYSYLKAVLNGMEESKAKKYGFAVAVCGALAKRGLRGINPKNIKNHYSEVKKASFQKKKREITEEDYDKIINKFGNFYYKHFLPKMRKMVEEGLTYERIKAKVGIPDKWGAKITDVEFLKRLADIDENKKECQHLSKHSVIKRDGSLVWVCDKCFKEI